MGDMGGTRNFTKESPTNLALSLLTPNLAIPKTVPDASKIQDGWFPNTNLPHKCKPPDGSAAESSASIPTTPTNTRHHNYNFTGEYVTGLTPSTLPQMNPKDPSAPQT